MNVTDYNDRLTSIRDRYQKAADELHENNRNNTENVEKAHKYKENKQAKVYANSKQQLEDEALASSEKNTIKTREAIKRSQGEFLKSLGSKRDEFETENRRLRSDYSEKLTNIRDEYDKSTRDNKRYHDKALATTENRLKGRISHNRDQYDTTLSNYQNESDKFISKYRDDTEAEKRSLVHRFNKKIQDNTAENNKVRNAEHTAQYNKVEKLRDSHKQVLEKNQLDHEGRIGSIRNRNTSDEKANATNFVKLSSEIQRRNESEKNRMEVDNKFNEKSVKEKFEKASNDLKRLAESSIAVRDGLIHDAKSETARVTGSARNRIQKISDQADSEIYKLEAEKKTDNEAFKKTIREQNIANSNTMGKRDRDNYEQLVKLTDGAVNEKEQATNLSKKMMADQEGQYESRLSHERKQSKKNLQTNTTRFAKTMRLMSEKNRAGVERITTDFAREKTDFIEKAKREMYHKTEALKDHLRKSFARKTESLEQNLEHHKIKASEREEKLENRLHSSKSAVKQEFEHRRIAEEDQRIESQRALRKMLDDKDADSAKRLLTMKKMFDRELEKNKHRSDMETTKISDTFKDQIKRMTKDHSKEISLKLGEVNTRYERLKTTSELEKASMKNQFEVKIDKLRNANIEARERVAKRSKA